MTEPAGEFLLYTYAEDQARRRRAMSLADWMERLDLFLRFNERDLLSDAGRIANALVDVRAADEYARFQAAWRPIEASEAVSGFDRGEEAARRIEKKGGAE